MLRLAEPGPVTGKDVDGFERKMQNEGRFGWGKNFKFEHLQAERETKCLNQGGPVLKYPHSRAFYGLPRYGARPDGAEDWQHITGKAHDLVHMEGRAGEVPARDCMGQGWRVRARDKLQKERVHEVMTAWLNGKPRSFQKEAGNIDMQRWLQEEKQVYWAKDVPEEHGADLRGLSWFLWNRQQEGRFYSLAYEWRAQDELLGRWMSERAGFSPQR